MEPALRGGPVWVASGLGWLVRVAPAGAQGADPGPQGVLKVSINMETEKPFSSEHGTSKGECLRRPRNSNFLVRARKSKNQHVQCHNRENRIVFALPRNCPSLVRFQSKLQYPYQCRGESDLVMVMAS